MPRLVVVGSINMDLVTQTPRFPAPGETVLGTRFATVHGGKGANQAVAAARLGAQVHMVGALGDDAFGDQLHAALTREGVALDHVQRRADSPSGSASITVAEGENQIIVVPGANTQVTPAQVQQASDQVRQANAVLVQLEIPLETVDATLRLGQRLGVPVILNPAPAQSLPIEWLKRARYVTPNEHELATLLGLDSQAIRTEADIVALMRRANFPIVLTQGRHGAWFIDKDMREPVHQPSFKVTALDSTGAGDTFNAALAVFLQEGLSAAVRKACAAAALSVTRFGAQGGMPTRDELEQFLASRKS